MRVNFTLKVKKAANNNTRLAKSEDNTRRPSGRRSGFVFFFWGGGNNECEIFGYTDSHWPSRTGYCSWLVALVNKSGCELVWWATTHEKLSKLVSLPLFFFSFRVPFREPTETNRTRLPIGYRPDVSRPIRDLVLPAFRLALRGGRESKEFENST